MANGTQTTETGRGTMFQLYKPTQGYWTRMSTAVGAGALILWGGSWIFEKLSVYHGYEYGLYIQVGAAVVFMGVLGYLLYWAIGKNHTTVDFLVSVEGEMKKVNWSSWPEIVGATKVVILFVVLMSLMLLIVDTFFMLFFSQIKILKGPGFGTVFGSIFQHLGNLFSKK
jgi:preprotein translocase subunit SecE